MIEGFIDFNHEHLQVPNMNGFFFIFNKQLKVVWICCDCTQFQFFNNIHNDAPKSE